MIGEIERIKRYKELNPNELSKEQFLKLEHEIEYPKENVISDEYFDFKLWMNGYPSRQEQFAEFVAKKLSGKEDAKILEVGAGRTARLSRILSGKGFKMTCIDPKLDLDQNDGIHGIKAKFDYRKFCLDGYDYCIATEPCDATEHIVRACIDKEVSFMMTLCGVPHRLISGEMPKTVYEWYDYLVNIASDKIKLRYVSLNPFLSTPILRSNKF